MALIKSYHCGETLVKHSVRDSRGSLTVALHLPYLANPSSHQFNVGVKDSRDSTRSKKGLYDDRGVF